jgi:metal-sulfur cluster biosynthetic enzyme
MRPTEADGALEDPPPPGRLHRAVATIADIEAALRSVIDPELGADVVELGMVRGIDLADGLATIHLALTIAACPLRGQIEDEVTAKAGAPESRESRSGWRR